jgi:hypothetical protein
MGYVCVQAVTAEVMNKLQDFSWAYLAVSLERYAQLRFDPGSTNLDAMEGRLVAQTHVLSDRTDCLIERSLSLSSVANLNYAPSRLLEAAFADCLQHVSQMAFLPTFLQEIESTCWCNRRVIRPKVYVPNMFLGVPSINCQFPWCVIRASKPKPAMMGS